MSSKLAIDGGSPVRSQAFPPWPVFTPAEVESVAAVLRSGKVNYWTGNECKLFEQEFASYVGSKHAISLANGTLALDLALRVYGIGAGDEVIVTPRSFMASVSCVVLCGATPVFADVDPLTQNISAETISKVLSPNTKAIIPVHLAGWPCEMDKIMDLAKAHSLIVIEDCAQAHGAEFRTRPVGSMGHAAAFSFCQDKIMTTGGEGGMFLTNDSAIWEKAWAYKDHGKSYNTTFNAKHPVGFRWLHESFGTNFRLTEMQAALGREQLKHLPASVEKRNKLAAALTETCANIPSLRVTNPPSDVKHSYYKYYTFVRPDRLATNWTRDRICEAITAEGITCLAGSCSEIYLEKAFSDDLRPKARLPVAKELGETSLMFLVHPTISDTDIADTCSAIEKVLAVAGA